MKKGAFTLVELIVVITILAILATIGFVSFSGYLAWARDTNRVAQLKSMSDALELYSTKKSLPIPDDKVDIKASSKTIAYQGYIWKNVLETIEYTESWLDPKEKQYFSYYLTRNKKYFQLLTFLEEESEDVLALNVGVPFMGTLNATDYSERFPKVTGKKLWILVGSGTNEPIQENSVISASWYLDIAGTLEDYVGIFDETRKISGTGWVLQALWLVAELWWKISINANWYAVFESKGNWNYQNEFWECVDIELFSDEKIQEIEKVFKLWYTNYKIESDLDFRYAGDDSVPKHFVYGKKLTDFSDYNLHLNISANDHTDMSFTVGSFSSLICKNWWWWTNVCGTNGLPSVNTSSSPILLYRLKLQPNCDGATALGDLWSRNSFTFKGSYYRLLLK